MEVRWPSQRERARLLSKYRGPARVLTFLGTLHLVFEGFLRLLDWKARLEEAVNTAQQLGGAFGAVIMVVASPWFGISLIALGICYVIFVPEQHQPNPSGRIAIVAAWIACVLSGTALFAFVTFAFAVTLTGARSATGFLQISNIAIPTQFSTIAPGKQFGINLYSGNPTPTRLFDVFGFSKVYVEKVDADVDRRILKKFAEDSALARKQYSDRTVTGQDTGMNLGIWTTELTPPLTQSDVDGFFKGSVRFYIVTWLAWRDSNAGAYIDSLNDCRWLQPEPNTNTYNAQSSVWHLCWK
jgi:hypothetical protein